MQVLYLVVGGLALWILCGLIAARIRYVYIDATHNKDAAGNLLCNDDCYMSVKAAQWCGPLTLALFAVLGALYLLAQGAFLINNLAMWTTKFPTKRQRQVAIEQERVMIHKIVGNTDDLDQAVKALVGDY